MHARYLLTFTEVTKKGTPLFKGMGQYKRESKTFHDVLEEDEDEFLAIGIKKGYLEKYSCRKGVAIMVKTRCIVSPPEVSTQIRCG